MRILIVSILIIFKSLAFSQDSTKTKTLDAVTVTANFQETEIRKVARSIAIITSKDIENAPVKTLDGILQYAMNIDVRSRGPLGVQSDISIRGGNYDQTLIMLDGVKMNDPQTGHHSLNLPIAMEMIERIEVLQGGGSRVYGPSAFAGVINIITKKNQPSQLNLGYALGEFGLNKYNLGGIINFKKINLSGGYEDIKSNGYAKNTAFNRKNAYLNLGIDIGKNTQINANTGYFNNKFGASNFYLPAFYDQYEEVETAIASIQIKHNIGNNFTSHLTASTREHSDLYDFNNYRKTTSKFSSINFHETTVNDISWINKLRTNLGVTSIGLEWREEKVISNRLGDLLPVPIEIQSDEELGYQKIIYTKGKTRKNTSAYFEQFKNWNKATLTFGTLLNFNSQFGTNWYPGIDFSYKISGNSNLYASVNRALRFPTFTEMYLVGSTVKGDPNLKPEEAWSFEIGTKRNTNTSTLGISVFYKHSNSAIDKIKRPDITVPTMENIGNMNTKGVEVNFLLNINKITSNEKAILQTIKMNYAYINSGKKEENFQSFYTLNYLKHKGNIGFNWRIASYLSLDTWYTYKNRAGQYQWDAKTPAVNYAPIHLVDARLNWQKKYFKIFVDGTNLLNKSYYEYGFVQQPGRWLSGGVAVSLK
jgi:vitamin B12 transporter